MHLRCLGQHLRTYWLAICRYRREKNMESYEMTKEEQDVETSSTSPKRRGYTRDVRESHIERLPQIYTHRTGESIHVAIVNHFHQRRTRDVS